MAALATTSRDALTTAIGGDAPLLSTLLGGEHASVAVAALGRALLGDPQAAVDEVVAAARQTDPATRLMIKEAGEQIARQLDPDSVPPGGAAAASPVPAPPAPSAPPVNVPVAPADEFAVARTRQVTAHDRTSEVLAYLITFAFLGIIIALICFGRNVPTTDGAKDVLFALVGTLGTAWATVIAFYFGSSTGSQQKSQVIGQDLLKKSAS